MRILVTGGYGFLGKWISKNVRIADQFFSFDIVDGNDITDYKNIDIAIQSIKPDVVVHAAAVADLYQSDENRDRNYQINVTGTYQVAKACSSHKVPIVYISTCCAYGNYNRGVIVDELSTPKPTETYAWSKIAGESVLGCVGKLDAVILRLGTFYGPDMRNALFNAKAISCLDSGDCLDIHGDGSQTRQYIYVDDVAKAVVKSCYKIKDIVKTLPENQPEIINIIGDERISVNDTVECINETARFISNEKDIEYKINYKYVEQRAGQIMGQSISNDLAFKLLDWKPMTDYCDGIKKCVEYRENGKS